MRNSLALCFATVAAAFVLPHSATAQTDWPNRTITLIVPFAPGGDANARLQAAALGEILGQTIIIENIGGAAGTVGSARAAKAAPDGYTMLFGNTGTHTYSQSLYKKPPYNSVDDFTPAGIVTDSPRVLIARKEIPANNLQEFVAYAKANQGKMQYGSAGVGSGTHLPCALFNWTLGLNITHVPYRGDGPALQDVAAGRLDYMCATIQAGAPQAKSGSVKAIAVMSPRRSPIMPELATTGEQGIKDVEATVWNGFFFPKGTPDAIVKKFNDAVNAMLQKQDVLKKMADMGLEVVPPEQRSPDYMARVLTAENERWGKVIRAIGVSMD
jgi:tripartite-type tricarboxylate transporter receptor subunit TctC